MNRYGTFFIRGGGAVVRLHCSATVVDLAPTTGSSSTRCCTMIVQHSVHRSCHRSC